MYNGFLCTRATKEGKNKRPTVPVKNSTSHRESHFTYDHWFSLKFVKYRPLWHLLSNYIVEHILISVIGTCHCICPRRFARPKQWHHWFCKFWVVGQKPEFILAGKFVYVCQVLIPRKKLNLTTQTQSAVATIGCSRMNATESSCVLCCEILVFHHMFLHKI